MATPGKSNDEHQVSRTYRAAIRLGEDFITLEETITLPIDASDEDVTRAVDLGWRIYQAQRAAVEAQVAGVREAQGVPAPITIRDPDAPASEKQRNYIATLQENLIWSPEQLTTYATEQSIDLIMMTKGQASSFIDGLKKLAEERVSYSESTRSAPREVAPAPRQSDGAAVNDRQLRALENLAQNQHLDLDTEARRRYGMAVHGLTYTQAAELLKELQPRGPRRQPSEAAL